MSVLYEPAYAVFDFTHNHDGGSRCSLFTGDIHKRVRVQWESVLYTN